MCLANVGVRATVSNAVNRNQMKQPVGRTLRFNCRATATTVRSGPTPYTPTFAHTICFQVKRIFALDITGIDFIVKWFRIFVRMS